MVIKMMIVVVSGSVVRTAPRRQQRRRCTTQAGERKWRETRLGGMFAIYFSEAGKVWRENDGWGPTWGWEGRRGYSWPHTGTLSHSLRATQIHTHTRRCLCFGKSPKAPQRRSILLLTSFSLCYPPLLTHSPCIHLADTVGLLSSFNSTEDMSAHKWSMSTQLGFFFFIFHFSFLIREDIS